ncbi:MAG: ATP-binding protein [Candidatus Riflebacteria bacterium]|nr:ATP-binding protein [Candidatus Riflebacteria bacterium]
MKLQFDEKQAFSQKMEAIGRLAAGIAHEINTPMQYIGDNTRFLKDAFGDILRLIVIYRKYFAELPEGDETRKIVAVIEAEEKKADITFLKEEIPKAIQQSLDGIDRVSKIVLAMKEFGHPGFKEKTFSDINRGIHNTVIISRNEWKYVSELKLELQEKFPRVFCSIDELNQVILNLIVNSSHAIEEQIRRKVYEKGLIIIKTYSQDDFAVIRITDNGCGIPNVNLQKIFDPFFTTKEVGKGTGQGLAIAHDVIVNKHRGSIDVESEPGLGATFIIKIPFDSNSDRSKS